MKVDGCLSRMEVTIERDDTFCVASSIGHVVHPLLVEFRKYADTSIPMDMEIDEWTGIIDTMIETFALVIRDGSLWDFDEDEWKTIKRGLKYFRKYYFDLWW